jgi:hypothetical protein
MRITLVDGRPAHSSQATDYVAELGPILAEEQQITILTLAPGVANFPASYHRLRQNLLTDRPEIVHLNNLNGSSLAAVTLAIGNLASAFQPALAITLHDDRLFRFAALNRALTRSAELVIAPTALLLDQHLAHGFFPRAARQVIPYAMPYHADRLADAYRRLLNAHRAGELRDHAA